MLQRIAQPYTLKEWQEFLREFDPAVAFCDYSTAFHGTQRFAITPQLVKILEESGPQRASAVFAVRNGTVDGIWLNDFHNYFAIVLTKESGSPVDHVAILSLSPKQDTQMFQRAHTRTMATDGEVADGEPILTKLATALSGINLKPSRYRAIATMRHL